MFYFTLSWIAISFVLLWIGNHFLTKYLNRRMPWQRYGNVRFFSHLGAGIIYSLLAVNLSYMILKLWLTEDPPTASQVVVMNVYGAIMFIPIFCLYFSLQFLKSWRKSAVEAEKFQKESIRSQLESLRSHLDPHFLFNSLNILASLIETDTERSKTFLAKFADVYRLILRSKAEDVIPLSEELSFITSYIYLVETRFGDSIRFKIDIEEQFLNWYLPPLTLQMLVENAIKHNVITEIRPLSITISSEGERLKISNSLNQKDIKDDRKRGSGHQNIRMRYRHYVEADIRVMKTRDQFIVTIPLIAPTTR